MTDPIRELAGVLGPQGCLTGSRVTETRIWDASGAPWQPPLALLRPASVAEVSAALAICHRHGLPVVPQGGLTGLAGGAMPRAEGVALSLSRFAGVEEIDADAGVMVVRAGTVLATAQKAAGDAGFLLPIDLGARGSCQIGGIVSTNAGGVRVIRQGTTRDNVLGLEAVLADGKVLSHLMRVMKDNTGYDLRNLIIGSEGTLAVVTRAVLRLRPLPPASETALCALADYAAVLRLLAMARGQVVLSAFEAMWRDHFIMSGGLGMFSGPPSFAVLIEVEGPGLETLLETAFEAGLIADALVARSGADARRFWDVRESERATRSLKGLHNLDVSLPVARMDEFATACARAVRRLDPGAECYFFGHIGDSNLHAMIDLPNHGTAADRLDRIAYDLVQAMGGSISAEHGIGTLKRPWLNRSRSADEIAAMRAIKSALDPKGILNASKVI
ncbi:FAD-binding oxidoreductase [Paenirhodobacter populi]|uniref:FAD-binding oxidoreductase n=1 Tax=Paenirhodobacter populi TaxID=2306993 RepID=UPI000FE3B055|nr:FAD-binding oxidoreductase [Sinirhodobacter populi]RWR05353.1 FAD-binding oxidoreductase [Sinirhodobacter populi]